MCSCRRRTGASDLRPGLTCKGNAITSCGADCPIGWPNATRTVGIKATNQWCEVGIPESTWNLKACPSSSRQTTVKVLTYNLFWWNLFGQRGGSGRSAAKLIVSTSGPDQYDLMAFQECDDRWRVVDDLRKESMSGEYDAINGGRALAVLYRKSRWTLIDHGTEDVGEDSRAQYYGRRSAMWARLRHRMDGIVVFFVNHHGPLPVSWGGGCTGSATALNIMKLIADNAHPGDRIVLVGDFNAEPHASRIGELDARLNRVFTGTSMGGVDHIYSNCAGQAVVDRKNLGSGGSDHDALSATFVF